MSRKIIGTFLNEKNILNCKPRNNTIILTIADYQYIQMAHNWYLHIKKCNLADIALICCTDLSAYKYALEHSLPCFFANINTLKTNDVLLNQFLQKNITNYAYKHLWKFLLIIDYITNKYNLNLIFTDVDMIVLKDFTKIIELKLQQGFQTCIYLNNSKKLDGTIFYVNQTLVQIFYERIKSLGLNEENIYDFARYNIPDCSYLDKIQFTCNSLWPEIQNKDDCYIIHYNNTQPNSLIDFEKKFKTRFDAKKYLLMQDGFWLLK